MRLQMLKVGSNFIFLAVIMIYSVPKKDEDYQQVFLKEHKYNRKENKVARYTTKYLKISSDDSDRE